MPESILDCERLSLNEAARQVGVHVSTLWRWTLHGVGGRRLPTVRIGGRRYVLTTDLESFLAKGHDDGFKVPSTSERSEQAGRELERDGI